MDDRLIMRIDTHQHFWRYNAAEYGWIDESMSALRRDFLPADCRREMDRAGSMPASRSRRDSRSRRRAGCSSSLMRILLLPAWWDGSTCRQMMSCAQLEPFAAHPKLVGVRHIVQGEPDDRFMLRSSVLPRHLTARRSQSDLRYPHLSKASSGCRRAGVDDSGASASCSTISRNPMFDRGRSRMGERTAASSRSFRTCSASCRAW